MAGRDDRNMSTKPPAPPLRAAAAAGPAHEDRSTQRCRLSWMEAAPAYAPCYNGAASLCTCTMSRIDKRKGAAGLCMLCSPVPHAAAVMHTLMSLGG